MSGKKQGKNTAARKDDGYPFDTGDWAKWTNVKRLNWLRNFRDKLRGQFKDKFGIPDDQIAALDKDVAAMEQVVASEQAARKVMEAGLKAEMDNAGDEILRTLDSAGRKAIYLSSKNILGKKGN